ncbi:MAG: DUF2298 domain-containing protein [Methanospirillum sp.]|uniref:DUF2298 domain-containing protein n=1 Tax=Methanospirillum sp. TaxID=45200 RepID=UPI002371563F|nr:DUF2298 domain-containing protein [Methanospirillum sp.]MDD1729564.1 DUF2298 domain-containing protein [Methanospirillum sp.]
MAISLLSQLIILAEWFILLLFLQLSTWPFLKGVTRNFAVPLSFPVSLLLATVISWYLALVGAPVLLMLVPFIVLFGYIAGKGFIRIIDLKSEWRWYALFYGTFILTLLAKIWYDSAIDISYEKFMDSMILSSMMHTPQIPPLDGWFAGGTLSWYYYLGAWMFAIPGNLLGLPASVVYNLVIPTVFAMSAVMIYSCSSLLMNRFRYLPLSLLFISYPGFFILLLISIQSKVPLRFILDSTTRILPGAVTENPLSALFIGSPRPYAVAMMIQCLIIFLLIYGFTSWKQIGILSRGGIGLILALCLGTLIPLHSWDVLIYLPIAFFTGLIISYRQLSPGSESFRSRLFEWYAHLRSSLGYPMFISDDSASAVFFISIITPVVSILTYLPFLFELNNQRMQGITFLPTPSAPLDFLLIHGLFILLLLVYLRNDLVKKPLLLGIPLLLALTGFISAALVVLPMIYLIARRFNRIEEILAFAGLSCILFCEFFAMVQNGAPDRSNTTYKFYFASWILLGISSFSLLGGMLEQCKIFSSKQGYQVISVCIIGFTLLFPVILLSSGPLWPPSLDGTDFVSKYIGQEESDALDYLKTLPVGEVLVEGVVPMNFDQDDAAKYFSRVSTYTGIPSVMGSYFRERVYQGTDVTHERGEDSVLMYLQPERAAELMAKHHATLLYVGIPEITIYKIQNPGIYSQYGFVPVFHENSTVIWRPPYYS